MSFALSQYQSARANTASPVQIVVDLYRGAIRFLRQAKSHQERGQTAERGVALGRAHAIVSELQATLDHSKAPQLCQELERLYDFCLHQITEANLRGDVAAIEGAVGVLSTLESAWAEIAGRG
jgi:flagellar protein FliS